MINISRGRYNNWAVILYLYLTHNRVPSKSIVLFSFSRLPYFELKKKAISSSLKQEHTVVLSVRARYHGGAWMTDIARYRGTTSCMVRGDRSGGDLYWLDWRLSDGSWLWKNGSEDYSRSSCTWSCSSPPLSSSSR